MESFLDRLDDGGTEPSTVVEESVQPDGPTESHDSFWRPESKEPDLRAGRMHTEERLKPLDGKERSAEFEGGLKLMTSAVPYTPKTILDRIRERFKQSSGFGFKTNFTLRVGPVYVDRYTFSLLCIDVDYRLAFFVGYCKDSPDSLKFLFVLTRPHRGLSYVRVPYEAIVAPVVFKPHHRLMDGRDTEILEDEFVRQRAGDHTVLFGRVAGLDYETDSIAVELANVGRSDPSRFICCRPKTLELVNRNEGYGIWVRQICSNNRSHEDCLNVFKDVAPPMAQPLLSKPDLEGERKSGTADPARKREYAVMATNLSIESLSKLSRLRKIVISGHPTEEDVSSAFGKLMMQLAEETLDDGKVEEVRRTLLSISDYLKDRKLVDNFESQKFMQLYMWKKAKSAGEKQESPSPPREQRVAHMQHPEISNAVGPTFDSQSDPVRFVYTESDADALLNRGRRMAVCPITAVRAGDVVGIQNQTRANRYLVEAVLDLFMGPTAILQNTVSDEKICRPTQLLNKRKTSLQTSVLSAGSRTVHTGETVEHIYPDCCNDNRLGTLLLGGMDCSVVGFPYTLQKYDVRTVSSDSLKLPDTQRDGDWEPCECVHGEGMDKKPKLD